MRTIRPEEGLTSIFKKKRFWLADENRWVTLTVSTQGLRLIDKIGLRKVLNKMKTEGKKV